jgi:hypothetical protein
MSNPPVNANLSTRTAAHLLCLNPSALSTSVLVCRAGMSATCTAMSRRDAANCPSSPKSLCACMKQTLPILPQQPCMWTRQCIRCLQRSQAMHGEATPIPVSPRKPRGTNARHPMQTAQSMTPLPSYMRSVDISSSKYTIPAARLAGRISVNPWQCHTPALQSPHTPNSPGKPLRNTS